MAVLGAACLASAQQSFPQLQSQGPAIIAHLNSVIQFYRAVHQPIQKAGEPNDVVYRDQAISITSQITNFAFESAKAEAGFIGTQHAQPAGGAAGSQQQRIQNTLEATQQRIRDLQEREAALDQQMASASAHTLPMLRAEKNQVEAALNLANAMQDALEKIIRISGATGASGLSANIDRLERSVPELQTSNKTPAPQLTTVQSALSAGVTSQTSVLFQLFETEHSLSALLADNNRLQQQATKLRAPMLESLRTLIQQGQQLSDQALGALAAPPAPAPAARPAGKTNQAGKLNQTLSAPAPAALAELNTITAQFKALSAASVPLSQEIIVLDQSHANLSAWKTSVDQEYGSIIHSLLIRLLIIAIALGIIIGAGQLWTHAANKYVHDLRRRRQLLIVRRIGVGFLSFLVLLFGFVTQFNSLATFAGFITAGIAVGLQTILLSVAAYFFIIGRYGIKVGDRITIATVTGDVIEVGLVRFYVMELSGTGTTLNPTGRVAVFSNAVLFQAGTPLYKQLPGSGYAWHELTVKLTDGADYKVVCPAVVERLNAIYAEYRPTVERQHRAVKNWMQASIAPPEVESRLQFAGGAFQLWARYPVEIENAAATDEKITEALHDLISSKPEIKAAVAGTPTIQPSVRG